MGKLIEEALKYTNDSEITYTLKNLAKKLNEHFKITEENITLLKEQQDLEIRQQEIKEEKKELEAKFAKVEKMNKYLEKAGIPVGLGMTFLVAGVINSWFFIVSVLTILIGYKNAKKNLDCAMKIYNELGGTSGIKELKTKEQSLNQEEEKNNLRLNKIDEKIQENDTKDSEVLNTISHNKSFLKTKINNHQNELEQSPKNKTMEQDLTTIVNEGLEEKHSLKLVYVD